MFKKYNKGDLIVISGPSGVGKDTVVKELLKNRNNIHISVSNTTRPKRNGEEEGKDYYFIDEETFKNKIASNEFLEYAVVHQKWYYGTPKKEVDDYINNGIDVILVIDIAGALKIKETFEGGIFIFILPPSIKELKSRLESRGTETKETLFRRFKTAYKEINEFNKYNYVVVNDNVIDAAIKISSIIESEKCRVDRIEELDLDSLEELLHEDLADL